MEWKARCRHKLKSAAGAVRQVRRGQRLFIGSGAAEPRRLVAALMERSLELADNEITHFLTLGNVPFSQERSRLAFRHNAFFIGDNIRAAVEAGYADYTPVFLSEIPRLFRSGRVPLDVALIQVSPPDRDGFCSYGVSVDIVKTAVECAELVLAEVNPRMPRTCGDTRVHVDRIDALVENDSPLPEWAPIMPDRVARRVGEYVAQLVEDGATLQAGIGRLPQAVLYSLSEKRDLGIHTEMISDPLLHLIRSGAVTGARKTLLPGKVAASLCLGSRNVYDFVRDNPLFEFRPSEFINDPLVIAQNRKLVAINGALEVDLTGQVCADSLGSRLYSGIGGQVDFSRGAARSEGGKPIIVLRSTARNGSVSSLVPRLKDGAGVVTTRGDVHYVVTEYGIADLWGKSVRERALALISVAHPRFRPELLEAARQQRLVYPDQILTTAEYPAQWQTEIRLRDGTPLSLRPIRPTDEPLLREFFYSCSHRTIYHRFFTVVTSAPHEQLQQLVNVDYVNQMAMVAVRREGGRERLVAVGRYVRCQSRHHRADVALIVQDDFQRQGLGTALLHYLAQVARTHGITVFSADVLADNRGMLRLLHRLSEKYHGRIESSLTDGVYQVEIQLPPADGYTGNSKLPS